MRRGLTTLVLGIMTAACAGPPSATSSASLSSTPAPCLATAASTGSSTTAPPARGYHQMFSLGPNGGVVVLGGETAPPRFGGRVLLDLWGYRPANGWIQLAPQTARTSDGPAVFDVASNRLIILGVLDQNVKSSAQNWVYDPTTDTATKKNPGNRPELSMRDFTMAYDAASDRAILYTVAGETWAYDSDRDAWAKRTPKSHPNASVWYAMAYDESQDKVVLFGGLTPDTDKELAETWTYDYRTDTWKKMSPAKSPPARHYSAMAYDPTSLRTILFGGVGAGGAEKPLCDTWAYDLTKDTWTQLSPSTRPTARGWHAMAFDHAVGKIVLFGGGPDRNRFQHDTWLFDSRTGDWERRP